jgi:hypothetical protein
MAKSAFGHLHFLRSYKHLDFPCLPLHKVFNVGPLLCQASVQSIHPIVHNPDKSFKWNVITGCQDPLFQMMNIADLLAVYLGLQMTPQIKIQRTEVGWTWDHDDLSTGQEIVHPGMCIHLGHNGEGRHLVGKRKVSHTQCLKVYFSGVYCKFKCVASSQASADSCDSLLCPR